MHSTWYIGLVKICVLLFGVAIGANWPEVFAPYTIHLVGIGAVLGVYLGFRWCQK
jgi:hypothetical protein